MMSEQLYKVIQTPHVGRSVVSNQQIAPGKKMLVTSLALSPIAHTIFRSYRREVCAWCFGYDRGREWKVRQYFTLAGVIFCSDGCKNQWREVVGDVGFDAYVNFRRLIVSTRGRGDSLLNRSQWKQNSLEDAKRDETSEGVPNAEMIKKSWSDADSLASLICGARTDEKLRKLHLREMRKILDQPSDPDSLEFFLTGTLHLFRALSVSGQVDQALPENHILPELMDLVADETAYPSMCSLEIHVRSYLQLLACLPEPLLPFISASLCQELVRRASHNAFSIRPSEGDDGEQSGEMAGWGIWPEASIFNHSCEPNLRKERIGRIWRFSGASHKRAEEGEEMCISYLGGDEKDMTLATRRAKLQEGWGFICACKRCVHEGLKGV